nr:reverse transcriptase domain-containing protein [Tanacetum cinerariifolium]
MDLQKKQKSPVFQIYVDILQNTNFFRSFTASAFDETRFTLDANLLREALEITPIDQAHQFVSPPSGNAIMDFVNQLGYTEVIHFVSRMVARIPSSSDALSPTKKGRKDKPRVILYCRFTKIIICHLGRNIHQRSASSFHLAEEDFKLGNLKFVPKGEIDEVFRMPIPDELISNNIINASYYNAYLEMVAKHDQKVAAEKEGKKKTMSAKQPKSKQLSKKKSTKTTLPEQVGKGKIVEFRKAKSPFQLVDEPGEEPAYFEPEPELEHQGKGDDDEMERAIQMSLKTFQAQREDVGKQQNIKENTVELNQGQARPDPGRTLESLPLPEHEFMDEDQAGPDPGESRGALVGPDLEPTHDDFMADLYPKVQESLKSSADEHVFVKDPISSTRTLSSMKNLEDAFSIGDQFINDKSTEDEPEKPNVEAKVIFMVTILIYQASSSVPPLDEFLAEKDKSCKRRRDDQDPPPPPSGLDLVKDLPMPKTANISDSEDSNTAHLPKTKQRPEWLKLILDDERPATLEPTWVIPSSHIPDAVNNWDKALPTTYQALAENSLLEKTGDMRTFMHWYCQQMGKTELTQADFKDYLQYDNKESGQALSISKMKDARYLDFGLEQLVPEHMWINEVVRTHMRILSVVSIKAFSHYEYDYLKEITLHRVDYQEYTIMEKDFKSLYPSDFEDLNLLLLQGFEYKYDNKIIDSPRAVVFPVGNNERKIMRFNEIYKFSDGTLTNIMEALDFRVKEYKNILVIPKYHSEDENPARANIKQVLGSFCKSDITHPSQSDQVLKLKELQEQRIFKLSRSRKDVQKLNGKLASVNRFLSKSAKNSLPFFKTLKKSTKKSDFQWTAEMETGFKQIKKSIAELPMLTAPKEKEELITYLAAAKEAISAVLMTERSGKQMPVYFVSCAFKAHTIIVITEQPIKQILSNPKVTVRLLKWSFKLEGYDIHYRPRTSVKGLILADFFMERPKDDSQDTPMEDKEALSDPWILFTDGSSCIDGFGAGLIITNPEGMEFTYALRTNGHKNLKANVDSRLVANQVNGTYIAKEPFMIKYSEKVLVEELKEKSIDEKEVLAVVEEEGHMCMTPIHEYLMKEILPEEKRKARATRRKARRYAVTNRVMYKRSFLRPWLRCVRPLQANYVLREIHEGSCSMHAGPRSMFRDNAFKDWCEKLCIRQFFTSVKHPQANDLVERENRSLGEGIKARFDERIKNRVEEISHVLWLYRIIIKSSNGETPFSLTYGTEAVIPVEIGMPNLRTTKVDMIKNDETLEINLGLLEEKREQAAIQEAKSKAIMEKYYNARVRNTSFKLGDLVYRSNKASHAEDGGKLEPKWEGPYEVTEALGNGVYKLKDRNENILPRTWNICNLKKCYVHEI